MSLYLHFILHIKEVLTLYGTTKFFNLSSVELSHKLKKIYYHRKITFKNYNIINNENFEYDIKLIDQNTNNINQFYNSIKEYNTNILQKSHIIFTNPNLSFLLSNLRKFFILMLRSYNIYIEIFYNIYNYYLSIDVEMLKNEPDINDNEIEKLIKKNNRSLIHNKIFKNTKNLIFESGFSLNLNDSSNVSIKNLLSNNANPLLFQINNSLKIRSKNLQKDSKNQNIDRKIKNLTYPIFNNLSSNLQINLILLLYKHKFNLKISYKSILLDYNDEFDSHKRKIEKLETWVNNNNKKQKYENIITIDDFSSVDTIDKISDTTIFDNIEYD